MKILGLSNFIPEHICDIEHFWGNDQAQDISHFCRYVSEYIARAKMEQDVDGLVFPKSCDSSRIIANYLSDTDKFLYQLTIPSHCDTDTIVYMANQLQLFQEKVERYYGIKIDNISERITNIENRNEQLKKVYDSLDEYTYESYIKFIHNIMNQSLNQEVEIDYNQLEKKEKASKKVFLIGSTLCNLELIKTIEEMDLSIVGDNLPESGRLVSTPKISTDGNIYYNIAKTMLERRMSPTQNDFSSIVTRDIEEILEKNVEGVIFVTQKYCEAYDYLFYIYEKEMKKMGIPILKLDQSTDANIGREQMKLEVFRETL